MLAPYFHGTPRHEMIGPANAGTSSSDSDSRGTTITAHATPGTDGAYTQLIASTAFSYDSIQLALTRPHPAAAALQLVDIAIGAASSEVVIVADLPLANLSARPGSLNLWLPLHIPSGSRIAARVHRSNVASTTVDVSIVGCAASPFGIPPYRRCTTYGTVLASAKGTQIDPGGTANTKSAHVEIEDSTANPIKLLYAIVLRSQTGGNNSTDVDALTEFYVGAASSEQPLVPYCVQHMGATGDVWQPRTFGPFKVDLPAGVRITGKAQSSGTTANAREVAVTLLGLD